MGKTVTQILKTTDVVKEFLNKHPTLRDDDKRLVANFWNAELKSKGVDIAMLKASDFVKNYFLNGEITNPDTITRARRKVQETCPELRGDVWNSRKGIEKDVRKNINK